LPEAFEIAVGFGLALLGYLIFVSVILIGIGE